LIQGYPGEPTGRLVRHLTTLAAFISGIVASQSPQLLHIATQVPDGQKPESRVKRLARWLDNECILEEMYFLPYAKILLPHLALETLVLVMDGSVVGRGCVMRRRLSRPRYALRSRGKVRRWGALAGWGREKGGY
jgi:hypothetical protein